MCETDLPFESLRPVFQEEMNEVRTRVLNHIKAKTFRGANMSGAMLFDLATAFVDAINSGGVRHVKILIIFSMYFLIYMTEYYALIN